MTILKLTRVRRAAKRLLQSGSGTDGMTHKGRWAVAAVVPFALTGCINVNAPTEPIVIELNINIRQEVIYRLADDAGNTIEENADIF
ncbi:YnbE family lipoprotein [Parerythrobacter lacustris]|uniref:YnbE family lipoprotein n=1 Tax=Parerythrobacter lacustris TaxID=2969984 RepID=A0ABT1XTJ9_9SPHN|nr:YnbE family lipoprotein [Parerythrobacter lacustris]MCR2834584.1 YnbE family lipoprotein [Parerythrobacter lacustris]